MKTNRQLLIKKLQSKGSPGGGAGDAYRYNKHSKEMKKMLRKYKRKFAEESAIIQSKLYQAGDSRGYFKAVKEVFARKTVNDKGQNILSSTGKLLTTIDDRLEGWAQYGETLFNNTKQKIDPEIDSLIEKLFSNGKWLESRRSIFHEGTPRHYSAFEI